MDFYKRIKPAKRTAVFKEDGYFVWCGSVAKYEDKYYLFYSRWDKKYKFEGWVTNSEICIAESEDLFGEFKYKKVLFTKEDNDRWDSSCKHNPQVLEHEGKYYLYYMGNKGNGEFWSNRNNQRIGVAWADSPLGEWHRFDKPIIDVSESGYDSLMTSNPAVTVTPDNKVVMVYKGVENNGKLPKGGAVACCVAVADTPLGEFRKMNVQIMKNPENDWSVEDPFIWYDDGRYLALVKDFQGYFTGLNTTSVALFESQDAIEWKPAENPLAFTRRIVWEDGEIQQVHHLERPQLYFEDNKPKALLCACSPTDKRDDTFNIRFGIE